MAEGRAIRVPWVRIASLVVAIVAELVRSLRRDTPGGRGLTVEEREEAHARAIVAFGGMLDEQFPHGEP